MDELIINPSRKKWITRVVLAIIGLLAGLYIGFILPRSVQIIPQWLLMTVGVLVMSYCFIMILMSRNALSANNKGLRLDRRGILDDSSIISYGEIKWNEVVEVIVEEKQKPRILVVVKKPQVFIKSASNNAIKNLRQKNLDDFGSPVLFESDLFDFDLEKFEVFLRECKVNLVKREL